MGHFHTFDSADEAHRRPRTAVAVVASALLMLATLLVGTATADDVACGDVITQSTTLTHDVGPCPGDGLIVRADGITLDLNGYRIFADNGDGDNAGIRLARVTGVTVTGGTVEGFDAGMVIGGGGGHTVWKMTARDNINDFQSRPCLLGDGIAVFDSDGNVLQDNVLVRNGPFGGISLVGDSDGNLIARNDVRDHDVEGIGCGNPRQDEGIRVEGPGADDNRIEKNRVTRSLLSGIGLHGYVCDPPDPEADPEPGNTGNVVVKNDVSDTTGTSIASGINLLQQGPATIVCPAYATTIEKNTVTGSESDGIFVAANSYDNRINHNTVTRNDVDGIRLNGPRFALDWENLGPTLFDVTQPDLPPYTEGADYRVMFGSGSGDVTAELVAIDITLAPGADATNNPQPRDTSTSGCEQADYDAAGFQVGDVALIQRGTCTFVSKVALAIDNGASAVIMFNEGQADLDRTTHRFGSAGNVDIPVLAAEYSVGFELYQLTEAGEVVVHVVTNTEAEVIQAAPGAYDNTLHNNIAHGNGGFDGFDGTFEPPCDNNDWFRNQFGTVNQDCVATGGPGKAGQRGSSDEAPGHQEGRGQLNNRGADRAGSTA